MVLVLALYGVPFIIRSCWVMGFFFCTKLLHLVGVEDVFSMHAWKLSYRVRGSICGTGGGGCSFNGGNRVVVVVSSASGVFLYLHVMCRGFVLTLCFEC